MSPYQDPDAIPKRTNIALLLERAAAEWPDQTAVRVQASGEQITYRELARRAESIAAGMAARGVRPGDRACLFVPPGVDLLAATYALFRMGAVPVLLDPGMGRKRLLRCIERVRPRVLIGVPRAHQGAYMAKETGSRRPHDPCPRRHRAGYQSQDQHTVTIKVT